ncbi:hypothetical protein [Halobacillus sp. Marseille-Q1614]|uniref:hypothetical protein n=1 Tax=Halobacillus sp. Marseille-Q1614 TaxID=2709134 RepID=UPI00156DB70A|nr:hypothetical protein [Halobacillus sp. Marseille-Q1614]
MGCLLHQGNNFGTPVFLGDDGFSQVNFTQGFTFSFYGANYTSLFVNSNGNLTFNAGDGDFFETIADFINDNNPRIAALWDDLNPNGNVFVKQLSDRFIVTWVNVPEWPNTGSNTFQIVLYDSGSIGFGYENLDSTDGLVGVASGNGGPSSVFTYDPPTNTSPDDTVTGPTGSLDDNNTILFWSYNGTNYELAEEPCLDISCSSDIFEGINRGQSGKVINFPSPTVTPEGTVVSCTPSSGTFFPAGATEVVCRADGIFSCSFTVTIVTPAGNSLRPECIRTQKVYDWIADVNQYTNKTPLPGDPDDPATCAGLVAAALAAGDNITFECTPPEVPGPDATCEVLEVTNGMPGMIRVLWTVFVTVTVTNETTGETCEFDVPVQFDDVYMVCIPEPFDEDNVFCRITDVRCSVTNTVFLGNQVQVSVTVCKDIQIDEEVKLEVLAKFCQPRPNDILPEPPSPEECPGFEFPPQCNFFPRPNCDCQAKAAIDDINAAGFHYVLDALICDNCTLSQSTWSFTQTSPAGEVSTVTPRTIESVECMEVEGGIQMTVQGRADIRGAVGDFDNVTYTLTFTDSTVGPTTFNLVTGPISTFDVIVLASQLTVQDCLTFDDISYDRP